MTPEHRQLLELHAKRKIRAFLSSAEEDDPEVWAFWEAVYDGAPVAVDHETALAVEHELMVTDKLVRDVLNGWRPESLAWAARARGGDA